MVVEDRVSSVVSLIYVQLKCGTVCTVFVLVVVLVMGTVALIEGSHQMEQSPGVVCPIVVLSGIFAVDIASTFATVRLLGIEGYGYGEAHAHVDTLVLGGLPSGHQEYHAHNLLAKSRVG